MTDGPGTVADVLRFFRSHWPHLLVAIPAAVVITIVHEAAHAQAVRLQGGDILEFAWLPSAGEWGHIEFRFPSDASFSPELIAAAPYALWLGVCTLAWLIALCRKSYPFAVASTVFIWFYVAPLGDIGNAALPYIWGVTDDFTDFLGPPTSSKSAAILAFVGMACLLGYRLQCRLYGSRAVSARTYAVICVMTVAGLAIVTAPV